MDKEITLGERIYNYRSSRGHSQLELSELLDVSRQSISKWETDVAVPELSKLVKMAEIFEVSLDTLVLGKEDKTADKGEEDVAEDVESKTVNEEPAPAPTISEIRERSRIKIGFGFTFLGIGILLSFLILLLAGDFLAALIVFIPFGVSAFFCLKQFRHAALWCLESWYSFIICYTYVATGVSWQPWLSRLVYASVEFSADAQTIMSFGFFAGLVFFISMTVFAYRKESFGFSQKKHAILACVAVLTFPAKKIASWLTYTFWFQIIGNGDKIHYATVIYPNYRLVIPTLDFLIDLAFTITFTVCLVPTFYWVHGMIKEKRSKQ